MFRDWKKGTDISAFDIFCYADLNGSLNIVRKVAGNRKFSKSVEGAITSDTKFLICCCV
jgi:hypothetical protein